MTLTSIRSSVLALGAAVLLQGVCQAQTYYYAPSDTPTTGTCNVFPWGQANSRHQHLVTAAELGNVAQSINDIAYAACTSGTFMASSITIRMNHFVGTTLSTDFTSNLGTGAATVLNTTNWSYNYTMDSWADVGLTGSFDYDPTQGNLLIDIEFCGASGGSAFHRDIAPRAWLNATCPLGNIGTAATGALKVRISSGSPTYFYAPSDTPTTGTCNTFPWGQSNTRHQHLVTAAELGNVAQTINDIGYAACSTGTFVATQITIRMNHFVGTTLSTDFTTNLGTGAVTVLNAANFSYGYTANAWADVGLTAPFNYDPTQGNLLIDIEFCGGSGGSSFHRDVAPRVWFNAATCALGNTGTSATGALKVRLCTASGNFSSFGSGCGSPPLTISGTGVPNIGNSVGIAMSNGLPGSPGVYVIGGAPTSIDLTFLGAPGCTLYTLPILTVPTAFDGSGNSVPLNLPIPNNLVLVGLSLILTGADINPPANTLGLTTANGLTMTIGS